MALAYFVMEVIGILIFLGAIYKGSKVIRIDWTKLSHFIAFMVFLTALRFGYMEFSTSALVKPVLGSFKNFPFVFWEDAFFAMPIYFVKDHLKLSKKFWLPVAIVLSLVFAYGHLAYGVAWALITLIYPYFLSYKYGREVGFGTVMAAHIVYDWGTLLSVKLFKLIKLVDFL